MDLENLEPVGDDENFDPSKFDRGDNIPDAPDTSNSETDEANAAAAAALEADAAAKEAAAKAEPDPDAKDEPAAADATADGDDPKPDAEGGDPEGDPKGEGEESQPKIAVPKERLDTEIARRKSYQEEARLLREKVIAMEQAKADAPKKPPAETYDFAGKTKEEYDAILEGDTEKAAAIRAEIDTQRMAQVHEDIDSTVSTASEVTQAEIAFKNTVEALTQEYPIFNPSHAEYDENLLQDVLFKRDAYNNTGMEMADALRIATKEVALINGIHGVSETTMADPAKGSGSSEADALAAKAGITRKLADASAQPPDMPGESSDARGEGKLDVTAMSEEEFNALPEATLKRLRGDA